LLTVSDSGIDIARDALPKVFEAFGQIDNSLTHRHDGTGLGLPLCKVFVELHGGRIGIDSEPGRGTTA